MMWGTVAAITGQVLSAGSAIAIAVDLIRPAPPLDPPDLPSLLLDLVEASKIESETERRDGLQNVHEKVLAFALGSTASASGASHRLGRLRTVGRVGLGAFLLSFLISLAATVLQELGI